MKFRALCPQSSVRAASVCRADQIPSFSFASFSAVSSRSFTRSKSSWETFKCNPGIKAKSHVAGTQPFRTSSTPRLSWLSTIQTKINLDFGLRLSNDSSIATGTAIALGCSLSQPTICLLHSGNSSCLRNQRRARNNTGPGWSCPGQECQTTTLSHWHFLQERHTRVALRTGILQLLLFSWRSTCRSFVGATSCLRCSNRFLPRSYIDLEQGRNG